MTVDDSVRVVRGAVCWVDLDPVQGSEANKRRPCVVVSNDAANTVASRLGRGVITVLPLTSNTQRVFDFQVPVSAEDSGLASDTKAQAEQIRAVDVRRITGQVSVLPVSLMNRIEESMRRHLLL